MCVTQFPPLVEQHREHVAVIACGKRLTFATLALPALRLLLSGHPVALETAADDVPAADVERLAKILMKEGLCSELTSELSSGYTGLLTNPAF